MRSTAILILTYGIKNTPPLENHKLNRTKLMHESTLISCFRYSCRSGIWGLLDQEGTAHPRVS